MIPDDLTHIFSTTTPPPEEELIRMNQIAAKETIKPFSQMSLEERIANLRRGQSGCGCGNRKRPTS